MKLSPYHYRHLLNIKGSRHQVVDRLEIEISLSGTFGGFSRTHAWEVLLRALAVRPLGRFVEASL